MRRGVLGAVQPDVLFVAVVGHGLQRYASLVHLTLINERRTEVDCGGCRNKHDEWFLVSLARAKAAAMLIWADFAQVEAYHPDGHLRAWKDRLDEVNLSDEACWSDFVYKAIRVQTKRALLSRE